MGSILRKEQKATNRGLLGVLNKMGSIQNKVATNQSLSLLGVLNKMGSIRETHSHKKERWFARCVKQDGFYTQILKALSTLGLLGVLNKMGSIPYECVQRYSHSLLGVLNKMGSIL